MVLIHSVFMFSSFGGLILDKTVSDPNFEGMAVFTPVINGKLMIANRAFFHYKPIRMTDMRIRMILFQFQISRLNQNVG